MYVRCSSSVVPFFISHYVQIKLGGTRFIYRCRSILYIPLRSDKTFLLASCAYTVRPPFISHYVQIKHFASNSIFSIKACFISHYVQIKRYDSGSFGREFSGFISHYVQIKPYIPSKGSKLPVITLYPTTFR